MIEKITKMTLLKNAIKLKLLNILITVNRKVDKLQNNTNLPKNLIKIEFLQ